MKMFPRLLAAIALSVLPHALMAFSITGTAQHVLFDATTTPTAANITSPGAGLAVVNWSRYVASTNVTATCTLGGVSPVSTGVYGDGPTDDAIRAGYMIFASPASGTLSLACTFSNAAATSADQGVTIFFLDDATATPVYSGGDWGTSQTDPVGVTASGLLAGDIVFKFDVKADITIPSTTATWTSLVTTGGAGSLGINLSYKVASGTTLAVDAEDEFYTTMVSLAFRGATSSPLLKIMQQAANDPLYQFPSMLARSYP
jgi:hypothetical protein